MKTPLDILNDVQIASPCPVPWESMQGDDRVRHCAECNKLVYDISVLTAKDALDLIHEKEGNICIQLYRRQDGTVLTADCPVGVRQRFRLYRRRLSALVASATAFLFFAGCESNSQTKKPSVTSAPGREEKDNCNRTGGIVPLPPRPVGPFGP